MRTIAMDFWVSLEHQIKYKSQSEVGVDLQLQLKECADEVSQIDNKMQSIHERLKI